MRIFITSLFAILLLLFGAKVKLVDSTLQEWFGGRFETGRGTDYTLTLKARGGSDKLIINKLWIGEELYDVYAVKDLAKRSDKSFKKGDTIFVRASKKQKPDKDGIMRNVSGQKIKPPIEYSSQALLVYSWKGKQKSLEIKEFRILEKIIYP